MPHALSCDKRIFVVCTIQRTFNAVVFSSGQNFKDEVLAALEEVEEARDIKLSATRPPRIL